MSSHNLEQAAADGTAKGGKPRGSLKKIGTKFKSVFGRNRTASSEDPTQTQSQESGTYATPPPPSQQMSEKNVNNSNNANAKNSYNQSNGYKNDKTNPISNPNTESHHSTNSNSSHNPTTMKQSKAAQDRLRTLQKMDPFDRRSFNEIVDSTNKSKPKPSKKIAAKRHSLAPDLHQMQAEREETIAQAKREQRETMNQHVIESQVKDEAKETESTPEVAENIQPNRPKAIAERGKLGKRVSAPASSVVEAAVAAEAVTEEVQKEESDAAKPDTDTDTQNGVSKEEADTIEIIEDNKPTATDESEATEDDSKERSVDKVANGSGGSGAAGDSSNAASTHKKRKVPYKINGERFVIYDYYKPTKVIGHGAYAVVIEAIDQRTGQKVAIKKNKGVFSALSDAKRILREIKLMLHFDHENIISLISVIPPDPIEQDDFDEVYLVMPKMETTLSRVVRSRQKLTEKHKQYFIYQLLRGLKYIHSAGVLHRDLKPENILINGSDCRLKITDFGLARGVAKDSDQKLTEYVVTRWYRAPEVMCSSRHYDESVDVWSVGCIMAELYLRKPFFPGSNHIEQLKLIFHYCGTPTDLSWIKTPDAKRWVGGMKHHDRKSFTELFPTATDQAIDLLEQMLEVNPYKRISVADALKHDWLKSLHRPSDDRVAEKFDLSFEFEKAISTLFGVRHLMYEELTSFHKNRQTKLRKRKKMFGKAKTEKAGGGSSSSSDKKIKPPKSTKG